MKELDEAIELLVERLQSIRSLDEAMEYRTSIILELVRAQSSLEVINTFLDVNYPNWIKDKQAFHTLEL